MVKKLLLSALISFGGMATACAEEASVIAEKDTVWTLTLKGITLAKRDVHRIDIAYDSTRPDGSPVRLSGSIVIPKDVYDGYQPCDGTVLYNHFTQTSEKGLLTGTQPLVADMIVALPLKLNYIIVSSDFAGFGIDKEYAQTYLYDTANAQASIDCLLAARELLDKMDINQGKHLFNVGYSSGGYDAMAVQKLRDNNYRDKITFDKTMAGGAPYDLAKLYDDVVAMKDSVVAFPLGMIMVIDSYNKNDNLGYAYADYLKEPYASKMDHWLNSYNYSTTQLQDSLGRDKKYSDYFTDEFFNPESEMVTRLKAAMESHNIAKNWNFDPTQSLFMMHLRDDNVVPVQSGREMLKLLKENDYTPYIVPYKTNLQTNFVIKNSSHSSVGGVVFAFHVASALFAQPVLYYDGELNPYVARLLEDATLMGIVKRLEAAGVNVRKLVQSLISGGSGGEGGGKDILTILGELNQKLQGMGTSMTEVMEMLDDSGVTLFDVIQLYNYLTQKDEEQETDTDAALAKKAPAMYGVSMPDLFNTVSFLTEWTKSKGVDIYE